MCMFFEYTIHLQRLTKELHEFWHDDDDDDDDDDAQQLLTNLNKNASTGADRWRSTSQSWVWGSAEMRSSRKASGGFK